MKSQDLRAQILALLGTAKYQPLDKVEISKSLNFPAEKRAELRAVLGELEQRGEIARIRKDRYVLPAIADLCTGVLQVHHSGGAHVLCESGGADLYVSAQNTGVAFHGDRVVARLMHEGVAQRGGARREGAVIRILQRANDTIVGTVQQTKTSLHVVPDDPRIPRSVSVHPSAQPLPRPPRAGDKVVVRLDEWTSPHLNPEGEIIELLGPASAPGVDMLSIIRKHHLPTEFPSAVLREAEKISEIVDEREAAQREDLRAQMIVTIDPDDAKDFDDAIHVEPHGDGWRLGVHIADVSHYVRTGSALDREAFLRGNSVYLVDRVIPMLPEKLSNGVCSLKPHVDRLTHSVFIDFTRAGKIKTARFARTVIHSAHRFTYQEAFAALQKPSNSPVTERLHIAWQLAALLRKNRFAHGSLELDFPEVKVWLDERGQPVRMEKVENDISHQLVEEFMLAANEVVAREIKQRLLPSVYRIHENPDAEKLAEFREFALSYGFKVGDLTQRAEVQKLLAATRGRAEEHAIKIAFLKSLKRAAYATNALGHYGLAKVNYTHFTSPIRRYADLVVHRVLGQISSRDRVQNFQPATVDLGHAAEHISTTERTAADAEKESVKLKKIEFLQNQLRSRRPDQFVAVVVDVRSYGLLVELPDLLLTGLIHVSALQNDFFVFDAARLRFVGRRTRKTYALGDKISVIVARVDSFKQQIDFSPA